VTAVCGSVGIANGGGAGQVVVLYARVRTYQIRGSGGHSRMRMRVTRFGGEAGGRGRAGDVARASTATHTAAVHTRSRSNPRLPKQGMPCPYGKIQSLCTHCCKAHHFQTRGGPPLSHNRQNRKPSSRSESSPRGLLADKCGHEIMRSCDSLALWLCGVVSIDSTRLDSTRIESIYTQAAPDGLGPVLVGSEGFLVVYWIKCMMLAAAAVSTDAHICTYFHT
jgi:ribosomal protein L15